MRRRLAVVMFGAVLISAAGSARAEVWVVDDGVRLDPVAGELFEERHPADGGIGADYRDDNPAWSRAGGAIRLMAARNEVVSFQVILDDGPHTGVALEVTDLTGPRTLAAGATFRRYKEWFVRVSQESAFCEGLHLATSLGLGWYPDPLIPLDQEVDPGFGQPFDIPDERNRVPDQTAAAFWVDLLVPGDTPPGIYRGAVRVSFDASEAEIPLELEVRDFTLGATNHAGLGANNYGGLGVGVLSGAGGTEAFQRWYQMAHAHRLELDAMWVWPPGTIPWEREQNTDWDAWREIWRPILSGAAFTADQGYWGPSPGEPVRRFILPLESNWPVDRLSPELPLPSDTAAWQEALLEAERIIIDEGWSDIEAHLFINATDEPRDIETFDLVNRYGDLIDGAGLIDRDHVVYRFDAGFFKAIGRYLPGWDTRRIFDEIGDPVDLWVENGSPCFSDTAATLERLEEHPDEMWWFYYSCSAGEPAIGSPALEAEALSMRTWGWIVWRYRMAGAIHWEMDGMRRDINANRCWTDPNCLGWDINGDAVILYLGEHIGLDGHPVASIRLKNMRRGSQDHEYLRLLAERDGDRERADAIAARIVPRALDDGLECAEGMGQWSHDPRVWEAARREVADILDEPDPVDPGDAGPDGGPSDGGPGDGGPGDADTDGGALDGGPPDGGGPFHAEGGRDCDCRAAGARVAGGWLGGLAGLW